MIVFVMILTVLSCDDDTTTPTTNEVNISALWDIVNLYEGDWDGYVNIQGRKIFGDSPTTASNAQNTAIAKFWDVNGETLTMNSVSVGDVALSPEVSQLGNTTYSTEDKQATRHLYGNSVNVSVVDNDGNVGKVDVYCPDELIISEPVKNIVGFSSIGDENRSVTFRWNADYDNDKGVGIAIDFKPGYAYNTNLAGYSHVNIHVLVDDDGEYTMTIDNRIPNGAIVEVYMLRGDVQGLDISSNSYLSSCYTLAFSTFMVGERP